jgi:hypothetical protein
MTIVDKTSLSATLDAVNPALFFERKLSKAEREVAAVWKAGRHSLPGAYAGMFAPTEKDLREGVTSFTGERLRTRAGTAHILGEEARRATRQGGRRTCGGERRVRPMVLGHGLSGSERGRGPTGPHTGGEPRRLPPRGTARAPQ